jgi:hypothetical protein
MLKELKDTAFTSTKQIKFEIKEYESISVVG